MSGISWKYLRTSEEKPNMTRYWKQVYQHNGFNTSKFNNKTTAIDNLAIGMKTQQDLLLG